MATLLIVNFCQYHYNKISE